jgi:hypothetical protein
LAVLPVFDPFFAIAVGRVGIFTRVIYSSCQEKKIQEDAWFRFGLD